MRGNPIPDDVRQFILSSIPSVPYLEALLLLRNGPESEWNAVQLARRLYQTERAAAAILAELHANGITSDASTGDGHRAYRYQPQAPELRDMIERLASSYSGNLVAISNLIHSGHSTSRNGGSNGRGISSRRGS